MTDYPTIAFASREELEAWLEQHHASADGVWLKLAKKGAGVSTVSRADVVELALIYGWIDGLARRVDDEWYVQKLTPRRARSKWSKINRAAAEKLIASGAMKPAGLREVERAKADGRWDAAYDSPKTATVPDDLQQALDASPPAAEFFASLNAINRYAILHRVDDAKKPETRARRIAKFVAMLERGERIHE